MSAAPAILLITHSRDVFTIDRVVDALSASGARPLRLDTDRFPEQVGLSYLDGTAYLDLGGVRVDGSEIRAVWTRSYWPPAGSEQWEPAYREASLHATRLALDGVLDSLGGGAEPAVWISPRPAVDRAHNKLVQFRAATACGLAQPPTLVTNEPDAVRRFFDACEGDVVTKMLVPLSMSMDRSGAFMPTSDLGRCDLEHLDSLRLCPMIFQRKVPKEVELRVAYVDGECFTGAIRVPERTDWRTSEAVEARWEFHQLASDIRDGLRRLMQRLGLTYGALDLIVTPEGEHVFLEVNPLGEWGMLERDLELPISAAISRALLTAAQAAG